MTSKPNNNVNDLGTPLDGSVRFQHYVAGEWKHLTLGSISDGYHTFDELYEHRNLLFLTLCMTTQFPIWWKFDPDAKDYFIMYLDTDDFGQISYHLPLKYLKLVETYCLHKVEPRDWDGHTSKDVIARLFQCVQSGGLLLEDWDDE